MGREGAATYRFGPALTHGRTAVTLRRDDLVGTAGRVVTAIPADGHVGRGACGGSLSGSFRPSFLFLSLPVSSCVRGVGVRAGDNGKVEIGE